MPRTTHDPLTDGHLRRLIPRPRAFDVRDAQRGLLISVLPSGRKQFCVRYVFAGKHRRLILGDFPAVTLSRARELAEEARTNIRHGHDPAAELRLLKAARVDTVEALAEDYLKRHARRFKRSADTDERILNADILPVWSSKSVTELKRRDVRALLERIVDRGSPIMANRVLALVRKMLNFAVDHDWIEANPAARISKPAREISRERVLTDDELRRLWRLLSHHPTAEERAAPGRKRSKGEAEDPMCPISPPLAACMKVRLLTAQRGGEVCKMRWRDVDLVSGWWTIPGTDTKNGEAHRVPLVGSALEIVKAQTKREESDLVFVGFGDSVMDRAKKAPAVIARTLNVDFRGHDLRRTAATRMAAAGVPRDYIARVLNHVEGGARATRVYDRHTYDPEKIGALQTWERALLRILEGPPNATEVVPIRARASG